MPYSSGTFSRVHDFTTDRDAGIKIQASRMDAEMDGIATGLSTAILKDGTQTTTAVVPFAFGISIVDNKAITLGTNSDITIQYDETTNDSLEIAAAVEGAALGIVLKSDQGDDNADQHKLSIADGGTLTLASKISGSFVTYLTHTPNSTVASSTLAVAGNLTVGGNLTLGSGAELSEAELEMLDGITAGTVAASKAVVVDSNKDIASFRNITLTGELDAGSLDVSGDADIDGTLEADAITVDGTALNTVIAGVTVTNATNSAHVLVTDNESTNEENLITFVEDATDSTGNVGLEMDGNLTYNPSTGTVTATVFKGNIDAVDGDFDGTLEADAMTLNGSAITTTATLSTGISNGNVLVATSGIADDDFLRVDGTSIEGRSASEVLSDIGASAVAGSSSIVTTGALNSGSITSGFGAIDNGSSNITTTGVGSFGSLDISGNVTMTSTDAGASTEPILTLYRNSSSPADDDEIGSIDFKGRNDNSQDVVYSQILTDIRDASDGAEDGKTFFKVIQGGTLATRLSFSGNGNTLFAGRDVALGTGVDLTFEGATGNSNETTVTVVDPTSDNTITLPDSTGTVLLQDSSGDVTITGGDIIFGTAGKGINLGVTSNTDSNTLDDYEEGTFTATLTPDISGSISLSNNELCYTKIGRIVHVTGAVNCTSVSSPDGGIDFGTLPFTSIDTTDTAGKSIGLINVQAGASLDIDKYTIWLLEGATSAKIYASNATQPQGDSANEFGGNETVFISLTYVAA